MHRSKLVMGGADAGAGGMSISSGSGGASGMGASSSSSDACASAMAQSTGLRKRAPARCAWRRARREIGVPRPPSRQLRTRRCFLRASDAIQMSTPGSSRTSPWLREMPTRPKTGAAMLCSWKAFEGAIEDGTGKRGARLRMDAALEASEDGHVAGL